MEILKFGDNPSPNRSNNNTRKPGAMIIAGVLVAMMGMSTTLAGTITISGGSVEFGQGKVSTAACDSDITVTPTSEYSYNNDTFTVSYLTLEGIADTCLGKAFVIKAFGTTATSLAIASSGNGSSGGAFIKIKMPDSTSDAATATNFKSLTKVGGTTNTNIAAVGFDSNSWSSNAGKVRLTGLSISNSITRLTIESADYNAGNDL